VPDEKEAGYKQEHEVGKQHQPAFPWARRPPPPAVVFGGKPRAGWRLVLAQFAPCFLNHSCSFFQPSSACTFL
jgi:hypothetical protein